MANETRRKRKTADPNDQNAKRTKSSSDTQNSEPDSETAGKVKRIFVRNFMCHDALEIILNQNVNFIVGRNGSGKSAILTALVVGLGAKATVTSRGTSVKAFIKKGKSSASVEISLVNEGALAYKPNVYGDTITVVRTIGSSSGYKLKNADGEVVSTKKDELERIVLEMNIQVENPISILNQDVSRTFLVASSPKDKYGLFMKATHLDKIGQNYKVAQKLSEQARQRLKESKQRLSEAKKEIDDLQKNVDMLESIEGIRVKHNAMQNELRWSKAIAEERKLAKSQASFEEYQNKVLNYEEEIKSKDMKEKLIRTKIAELKEQVKQIEAEAVGGTEAYSSARKNLSGKKDAYSAKARELKTLQSKIKRIEQDIASLRGEIQRLEADSNQVESEKRAVKEKLDKLAEQSAEVDAMLLTKKTDQMHFDGNKNYLIQEEQITRADLDKIDIKIRNKKRQLNALNQEFGGAVTIFGPNMPRLLQRIKEEHDRGKFKQMPRGPLGLHIKMIDRDWAAAVESFLGANILQSFCVDNSQDAKALTKIMKEVFRGENIPQIISSKFYYKIHDVSRNCTRAPGYQNLLEAMEISDPVVANCLIDQREVECVLLIPTSKEASEMLSDVHRVPKNCHRALTQQGDTFFPDPNYRSYGGRQGLRARYLQVSTTEAIKVLEEELAILEQEQKVVLNQHKTAQEGLQQAKIDLNKANEYVARLRASQTKIKAAMNELRDKCTIDDSNSVAVFTSEMNELLKKVETDAVEEERLKEELKELQNELETSEVEVRRCRDLVHCLDVKLEPIKKLMMDHDMELQTLRLQSQHSERYLIETQQDLQKATADLEIQQRVTDKAVADAAGVCPRINTPRNPNEINHNIQDLKANIDSVEEHFGSKEEIAAKLDSKLKTYNKIMEFATAIEISNDEQLRRLEKRRHLYQKMKKHISNKVQHSFQSVLALRKYQGTVKIDHENRLLNLEVNPVGSAKRTTNDARSLSGGERSYSTVAFILALWDCIELPFYFLDEFDVFMDKVNRRVIMDILLDHAKSHPRNQFTFLTPLDTSNISADDYVSIHQLAAPERAGDGAK
ncbi:structural maintenance of chromosomes protein 6 [Athalia rosae]|uniref:structural maintenance of chromosomes protein 6 n=1 Tax=Athalia rosae TaxID=37344 RepID=UPI0020342DA6|nr:structural maintenance of chromosomes protein 6 [Athalia rosae]XP_012263078.2 structural maintenance of chromosomes protein 6 [Athalia rosae]